jgi:hypothetical protein
MIKRRVVKSCCGHRSLIFEAEKPIRNFQLFVLEGAGYSVPANFKKAGIFYVSKGRLIATSSFGTNLIRVKCGGDNCDQELDEFEKILEQAVNTKKVIQQ